MDEKWFETWINALESPRTQIDGLPSTEHADEIVCVAYGETYFVGATRERAIAYT
jgi:hypothetical protein